MKKILFLFFLSSLLLVGCSSNEFEKLVQDAKALHDEGKYEESLVLFEKALEIDQNSDEVITHIKDNKAILTDSYITKGDNAFSEKNYIDAHLFYSKATSYDLDNNYDLAVKTDNALFMKEKQEEFDDYIGWATISLNNSYYISQNWERILSMVRSDELSSQELILELQTLLELTNEIYLETNKISYEINESLVDIHYIYLDTTHAVQEEVKNILADYTILGINEIPSYDSLSSKSVHLSELQSDLMNFQSFLEDYADKYDLFYTNSF